MPSVNTDFCGWQGQAVYDLCLLISHQRQTACDRISSDVFWSKDLADLTRKLATGILRVISPYIIILASSCPEWRRFLIGQRPVSGLLMTSAHNESQDFVSPPARR